MYTVLGWLVIAWIVLTGVGTTYYLWIAGWRPWMLRPEMPVPREAPALEWVVPDQDNPIPWI